MGIWFAKPILFIILGLPKKKLQKSGSPPSSPDLSCASRSAPLSNFVRSSERSGMATTVGGEW